MVTIILYQISDSVFIFHLLDIHYIACWDINVKIIFPPRGHYKGICEYCMVTNKNACSSAKMVNLCTDTCGYCQVFSTGVEKCGLDWAHTLWIQLKQ